jgi:putative SOS response-associated peptidase YedK
MSGYYKWQNAAGGKQPWYFTAANDGLLTAAALWDKWKDPESELVKYPARCSLPSRINTFRKCMTECWLS